MRRSKPRGFKVRQVSVTERGVKYTTFRVSGWLNGERIRRQFKSRDDALGEKTRLEVQAANSGEIMARNTRLSALQLAEAETAFARLGHHSLPMAVDWFLANYRPPLMSCLIETATAEFIRDREPEVSMPVVVDYRKVMSLLLSSFPKRAVDTISTAELEAVMTSWGQSKKSWNNLRTYLHAFFQFCAQPSRRWIVANPVKAVQKYDIARGIPQIMLAARVGAMFAFLETYSGPARSGYKPGYLVPYFALATFAGIRPSVRDGEIRKIHERADKSQVIDDKVGVIRITPEIAKTNDLRQIVIRPNLAAWLACYPIAEFPLIVPNMTDHVGSVRKRFGLTADVLRHTFISMHVGKFKSIGEAAIEAGNSEAMIKKHYLNLVSETEAIGFWKICPCTS